MAVAECFIRFLQRRDQLSEADMARLRAIRTETVGFAPGGSSCRAASWRRAVA